MVKNNKENSQILILEDNDMLRYMYSKMLAPYNPKVASNASDAVDIFRESIKANDPYPLVLTDIVMPGIDGIVLPKSEKAYGNEIVEVGGIQFVYQLMGDSFNHINKKPGEMIIPEIMFISGASKNQYVKEQVDKLWENMFYGQHLGHPITPGEKGTLLEKPVTMLKLTTTVENAWQRYQTRLEEQKKQTDKYQPV